MKLHLAVLALLACPLAAHAGTIVGTTVTGTLEIGTSTTNAYPSNPVVIGPGAEFTYVGARYTYTANFGAVGGVSGVTIDYDCTVRLLCGIASRSTMTFTDTAFAGNTFDVLTNDVGSGLSYSTSGDTLTVSFDGLGLSTGPNPVTFELVPAPTPEPGGIALLGTGLAGVASLVRRRIRR